MILSCVSFHFISEVVRIFIKNGAIPSLIKRFHEPWLLFFWSLYYWFELWILQWIYGSISLMSRCSLIIFRICLFIYYRSFNGLLVFISYRFIYSATYKLWICCFHRWLKSLLFKYFEIGNKFMINLWVFWLIPTNIWGIMFAFLNVIQFNLTSISDNLLREHTEKLDEFFCFFLYTRF